MRFLSSQSRGARPAAGFATAAATTVALLAALLATKAAAVADRPLTDEERAQVLGEYEGDFDGMLERRRLRVLTTFSKTFYFLDQARQRGLTHDVMREFEKHLNEKYENERHRFTVALVPVPRDELIPALLAGRGDIVAANLTITPEREKHVDFSDPLYWGVKEVVVTAPSAPHPASVDDLSGMTVHVRESSSYHESLVALNERFAAEGKAPVDLVLAEEVFEDEDLLEMVNADLVPAVVVDSHKVDLWQSILENITVHKDVFVREGGEIAWAMRKDSPKLAAELNEFAEKAKKGTLIGNMLFKHYMVSNKYVRNAAAKEELEKFERTLDFFKKYSDQYDFDWLVMAAVGYQESTLDQSKRSPAGAVGVMQLLPSTAEDPNVGIPDIEEIEPNIHAGVKYLHFLHHRYFTDPEIPVLDQWLMTFAAYNAGPAKVSRLREKTRAMGLDPNRWYRNVEVATAKHVGRETTQYVSNIHKYYIAYKLIVDKLARKNELRERAADS